MLSAPLETLRFSNSKICRSSLRQKCAELKTTKCRSNRWGDSIYLVFDETAKAVFMLLEDPVPVRIASVKRLLSGCHAPV